MDKVSVIIPVYNTADFLIRCVNSVLEQTYQNIEIILIDDCSTDNSLSICHDIEQKHSNVIVFTNPHNRGLEATRNVGLRQATGDWILFLDSDDTIDKNAINTALSFAKASKADILFASYTQVSVAGTQRVVKADIAERKPMTDHEFISSLFTDTPLNVFSCIGSKLYNVDFLKTNKIFFDETKKFQFNEDSAFMINCLLNNPVIIYINYPFYNYIKRSNSIQTSYRRNLFEKLNNTNLFLFDLLNSSSTNFKKQKHGFLLWRSGIYKSCLINDAVFEKYSTFKQTCTSIIESKFFHEVTEIKASTKDSLFYFFLKHRLFLFLYCLLKTKARLSPNWR